MMYLSYIHSLTLVLISVSNVTIYVVYDVVKGYIRDSKGCSQGTVNIQSYPYLG